MAGAATSVSVLAQSFVDVVTVQGLLRSRGTEPHIPDRLDQEVEAADEEEASRGCDVEDRVVERDALSTRRGNETGEGERRSLGKGVHVTSFRGVQGGLQATTETGPGAPSRTLLLLFAPSLCYGRTMTPILVDVDLRPGMRIRALSRRAPTVSQVTRPRTQSGNLVPATTIVFGRIRHDRLRLATLSPAVRTEVHQRYGTTELQPLIERGLVTKDEEGTLHLTLRPASVWWREDGVTYEVELASFQWAPEGAPQTQVEGPRMSPPSL